MYLITFAVEVAHVLLAIRLVTHDMQPGYIIIGKAVAWAALPAVGLLGVGGGVAQSCGRS